MSMRVGLFAPLNDVATTSGTGKYIFNLLSALADLRDDPDSPVPEQEYVVVTESDPDWVPPAIDDRLTVEGFDFLNLDKRLKQVFDDLGLDVVHFLTPIFLEAGRPRVFSPYDLRHLAYPEQFPEEVLEQRREFYPKGCRGAAAIDTLSAAVKEELVHAYPVDAEKVHPVPMGPALSPDEGMTDATDVPAQVPDSFVLFPAALWPHKNHERLVAALERIEQQYGERVPLVCTGTRDTEGVSRQCRVEAVPDAPQVVDLGYVEAAELRTLYRESRAVVYPSLYEGGGLPVLEAWAFDTPVACSGIPVLREKGGDAAVYFDPESVPEMADTIHEVWTDATLRETLRERARDRRELFTWRRTARAYHALYRKAAGRELSAAGRRALEYPHGAQHELPER